MTNLVGLWVNLFRAIEVAKTGGYSVSIYFDHEYKSGFDDYKSVKDFCKGWFDNFKPDGDLQVEMRKPPSYEQKGKAETLKNISARIKKTLAFEKPQKMSDDAISLLKTAADKLDLSFFQVERIKQISVIIAQMDFSKTIHAQHIAESIQYSSIFNDTAYKAESKLFGDMIQIKLGEIDADAIKSAIEYLNGLLH